MKNKIEKVEQLYSNVDMQKKIQKKFGKFQKKYIFVNDEDRIQKMLDFMKDMDIDRYALKYYLNHYIEDTQKDQKRTPPAKKEQQQSKPMSIE